MISSIWDKEPMSSDKCVQHLSNLSQMGLIPFAPSTFQKVGVICDVMKLSIFVGGCKQRATHAVFWMFCMVNHGAQFH